VQRETKEVLAELVEKLRGKLELKAMPASPGQVGQQPELRPNLDRLTVGVDLGDQWSHYCILGLEGERLSEGQLRTTQADVAEFFQGIAPARVVIEVGTHSAWVQESIAGQRKVWIHEVIAPGEGGGSDHRTGLWVDLGESRTVPQKSRCGALFGISAEAGRLRGQPAAIGISKTGDRMMRQLLVGSGQYILGPFGPDTDLRRYGLRLCERGGKNAKKRAVVAVARKLAVFAASTLGEWRGL
jgi:hypothetical protein